jgi:hypothetical protein
MKVGDLVSTVYSPDIGVIIERMWGSGFTFRVMWSNGQTREHNLSGLVVLCK